MTTTETKLISTELEISRLKDEIKQLEHQWRMQKDVIDVLNIQANEKQNNGCAGTIIFTLLLILMVILLLVDGNKIGASVVFGVSIFVFTMIKKQKIHSRAVELENNYNKIKPLKKTASDSLNRVADEIQSKKSELNDLLICVREKS